MKYNDPFAKNAPASKGAGGTGVGRAGEYPPEAKPPAPSEAGREVRVGDPAVSGTGLLSRSEPERTTSRPAAKKLGGKEEGAPGADGRAADGLPQVDASPCRRVLQDVRQDAVNRQDEEHLINGLESMVVVLQKLQEQIDLVTKIVTALDKRLNRLESLQ